MGEVALVPLTDAEEHSPQTLHCLLSIFQLEPILFSDGHAGKAASQKQMPYFLQCAWLSLTSVHGEETC